MLFLSHLSTLVFQAKVDKIIQINSCMLRKKKYFGGAKPGGGGGRYLPKFNTGRLRSEVQPLTLLYTILAEKVPLLYTIDWEKVPLSYNYFRKLHPFSNFKL